MSKLKVVYYFEIVSIKNPKKRKNQKRFEKKWCFALENSQGELSEIHEYSTAGSRARGLRRFQAARVKSGKKPYQIK